MKIGSVMVTHTDDKSVRYDSVSNVSISSDWLFIKFIDGGRVQIPTRSIREIYEESGVYVKGMKDVK